MCGLQLLGSLALVAASLCSPGEPPDVAQLIADLDADNPRRCARVAQSLGSLGKAAEPAIPKLVDALGDDRIAETWRAVGVRRRVVATFASEALVSIGDPAVPYLAERLKGDEQESAAFRRAIEALGRIGKPARDALPRLREIVENGRTPILRGHALVAYVQIHSHDKACVPVLVKALEDPSPIVRGLAAEGLGGVGSSASSAVPALVRRLSDDAHRPYSYGSDFAWERAVRLDAAEALGRIGPAAKDATDSLSKLMSDDTDPEVRVSATLALFRIDNDNAAVMPALIAELKDDTRGTAGPNAAASALETLGRKVAPAFHTLTESLRRHQDDYIHCCNCMEAIRAIGGKEAVSVLLPVLENDDSLIRAAAAENLGELGPLSAQAVPRLIAMLCDEDDDWTYDDGLGAAEALGKIGAAARAALPDLRRLAETDSYKEMGETAAEAVKRIDRRE